MTIWTSMALSLYPTKTACVAFLIRQRVQEADLTAAREHVLLMQISSKILNLGKSTLL